MGTGRCTHKRLASGKTRLYLHVFDWPKNAQLVVPGLSSKPETAVLLGSDKALTASATDGSVVIAVPAEAPDKTATVIALDIQGARRISGR